MSRESDRISRRIERMHRRFDDELRHRREPITVDELDGAIAFARAAGAPPWLVALLESHRREDAGDR